MDNPFGTPAIDPNPSEPLVETPKVAEAPKEELHTSRKVLNTTKRRGIVVKQKTSASGLLTKADVLKEYGNLESNIPINHPYWQMKK